MSAELWRHRFIFAKGICFCASCRLHTGSCPHCSNPNARRPQISPSLPLPYKNSVYINWLTLAHTLEQCKKTKLGSWWRDKRGSLHIQGTLFFKQGNKHVSIRLLYPISKGSLQKIKHSGSWKITSGKQVLSFSENQAKFTTDLRLGPGTETGLTIQMEY